MVIIIYYLMRWSACNWIHFIRWNTSFMQLSSPSLKVASTSNCIYHTHWTHPPTSLVPRLSPTPQQIGEAGNEATYPPPTLRRPTHHNRSLVSLLIFHASSLITRAAWTGDEVHYKSPKHNKWNLQQFHDGWTRSTCRVTLLCAKRKCYWNRTQAEMCTTKLTTSFFSIGAFSFVSHKSSLE